MKKILLLLFIFSSIVFGADEGFMFYVENPTMGKAYFNIFNAIVALMKSETYMQMLELIFLLGGFFVFVMGIFKTLQGQDGKEALFDFSKYMIAATMLLSLVLPGGNNENTTLIVESKQLPVYYCSEENNLATAYSGYTVQMPQSLAWAFSAINSIGTGTTEQAATVFSSVSTSTAVNDAFKSSAIGGYGSEIDDIKALLNIRFSDFLDNNKTVLPSDTFGDVDTDSVIGGYFTTFLQQCVFMVKGADAGLGTKMASTIEKTGYMRGTFKDLFKADELNLYDNAISKNKIESENLTGRDVIPSQMLITIVDSSGVEHTGTCGQFYKDIMDPFFSNLEKLNIACLPALKKVTPAGLYTLTGNDNVTAPIMEEIAINSGIVSAYRNAATSSRIATDISYATGKSQAEFVLNSVGTGYYMAKMLPYMQMGIRAVLYAFFPFVFLVMLLPGGFAVIKSYLQSMLWVELWSPVAAILNMFLSYFTIDQTASVFKSQGVNVLTQATIGSDANMLASVGGYLYASVPALTWLVLKGSAQMLGSITGGMASGFAKNLDSNSVRRDLTKAKEAELMSNKTNGAVNGIADLEMKKAMINAEKESEHDSMYFNMNNRDYLENARLEQRGLNRATAANMGYGKNMDQAAYQALSSNAEFEGMSDVLKGEVLNSMNYKDKQALANGQVTAHMRQLQGQAQTAKALGVDIKDLGKIRDVAAAAGNADAAKNIEGYSEMKKKIATYAKNHKQWNTEGMSDDEIVERFGASVAMEIGGQMGVEGAFNENQTQAYYQQMGLVSSSVNDMKSFEKELGKVASGVKFVDKKFDKKSGEFIATTESGETYHAKKGQFIRHTDADGNNTTVAINEKKLAQISRDLGHDKFSQDQARINIQKTFGAKAVAQSLTNKGIQDTQSGLSMTNSMRNAARKLAQNMDKNSDEYKELMSMANETNDSKLIRQFTDFSQERETLGKTLNNLVTSDYIDKANSTGQSVTELEAANKIASTISGFESIEGKKKALEAFGSEIKMKDKDGNETTAKAIYDNYREQGMDDATAASKVFGEMQGQTESFNTAVEYGKTKAILDEFGYTSAEQAKIFAASKDIGLTGAVLKTAHELGFKLTAEEAGAFAGAARGMEQALTLFGATRLAGDALKGVATIYKGLKGAAGRRIIMKSERARIKKLDAKDANVYKEDLDSLMKEGAIDSKQAKQFAEEFKRQKGVDYDFGFGEKTAKDLGINISNAAASNAASNVTSASNFGVNAANIGSSGMNASRVTSNNNSFQSMRNGLKAAQDKGILQVKDKSGNIRPANKNKNPAENFKKTEQVNEGTPVNTGNESYLTNLHNK